MGHPSVRTLPVFRRTVRDLGDDPFWSLGTSHGQDHVPWDAKETRGVSERLCFFWLTSGELRWKLCFAKMFVKWMDEGEVLMLNDFDGWVGVSSGVFRYSNKSCSQVPTVQRQAETRPGGLSFQNAQQVESLNSWVVVWCFERLWYVSKMMFSNGWCQGQGPVSMFRLLVSLTKR